MTSLTLAAKLFITYYVLYYYLRSKFLEAQIMSEHTASFYKSRTQ